MAQLIRANKGSSSPMHYLFQTFCESMIASKSPDFPWQKVASDLFYFQGNQYLLYLWITFPVFPEVNKLTTTTSQGVINALLSIFARHGIPEILMSDDGPQYSSQEMKDFFFSCGFKHITSSPITHRVMD